MAKDNKRIYVFRYRVCQILTVNFSKSLKQEI